MDWNYFADCSEEQKINLVQNHLDYLLKEGVVVKIGDKYRLKTDKEVQKEIQDLLNT